MLRKSLYYAAVTSSILAFPLKADEMQEKIKHVVVVMLENRSFDNVLAWLYSKEETPHFIPSYTDPHYLGLTKETLSLYTNTLKDSSGNIVFTCPPIKGVPSVEKSPYLNSPSTNPNEPFTFVTNQIFGFDGKKEATMSGFLQDYASLWPSDTWLHEKVDICSVMETYTERELPILSGLAKHYAVSDLWFSSVPTQTNPNRAFLLCGTSEGQIINNLPFEPGTIPFQSDTIWNRLYDESPETSWMIFWQTSEIPGIAEGPFTGPTTFFSLHRIPNLEFHYATMDAFHTLARQGQLPDFSFIEPQWTLAANVAPKNALVDLFIEDDSWVVGLQGNDFHPPGDVRPAENFLANIYTSLIANPEAWDQTLLIILFDEHGGLFDHVPPPHAIAPDHDAQNGFRFDRYGVRVPALFISPRIQKNTVIRSDTTDIPFDHTSLIATILHWKKIDRNKWDMGKRVEVAPTFEKVISLPYSRKDAIIKPDSVLLGNPSLNATVQMGDQFYLRDNQGNYLTHAQILFHSIVRVGSYQDRVALRFVGGTGPVTHGSFAVIQSADPALKDANILGVSLFHSDCVYTANEHTPGQWWTIKSAKHPYVGAPIHYGDPIYLENHLYLDPFECLPARLAIDDSPFGDFLKTETISKQDGTSTYWMLEKADSNNLDYPFQLIHADGN